MRQKRLIEGAHQCDRPLDKAGDFREQAFVFDKLVALRESQVLGVGKNDVGAARRIEHHFGFFELGDVVVKTAYLDHARRHETMAARFVATDDAVEIEVNDSRLFRFRTESRDDGVQRPHP